MNEHYEEMLTPTELKWVREILSTSSDWSEAEIEGLRVVTRAYCDEGLSVQFGSDTPQRPNLAGRGGYIGRVVITTEDNCFIEARLDHSGGRLRELFILFVDSKRPQCRLPYHWTESSHEVVPM